MPEVGTLARRASKQHVQHLNAAGLRERLQAGLTSLGSVSPI